MIRQDRLTFVLMILIIMAAFTLRVYRLGSDASFSADEVNMVTSSMQDVAEILNLKSKTPLQAFWVAFGAWVLGFGYSELDVYFLSAFVGVLAIVVVFYLGKSLFDDKVGLLAAFMLFLLAYHIYWSRSVRYYALMMLLSSVSFLCLYWALTSKCRGPWLTRWLD